MKENKIKKRKAILCTYNLNNYSIIRFRKLLKEYEIVGVKIAGIRSLKNKDWAYVYMGENTGISFKENCDDNYEVVIFGDGTNDYIFSDMEKRIENYAQEGKDICMLYNLSEEHKKLIINTCIKNSVKLHYHTGMEIDFSKIDVDEKRLYEIDVPIVLVVSVIEHAKKIDSLLSTKQYFENCGYKVSSIGSKSFSNLFGIHAFPNFMYGEMSEIKKILYFNAICKNIEYFEKPHIFLIGVPGGIISYNNTFTNFFGVLPFEVSQAVEPDYIILNIPYGEYDKNFFDEISGMVKYRLGCQNVSYVMTNSFIDINSSKQESKLQYCHLKYEDVEYQRRKVTDYTVYNILSDNQLQEMASNIESKLSYN